jgi:hypothetical protein
MSFDFVLAVFVRVATLPYVGEFIVRLAMRAITW